MDVYHTSSLLNCTICIPALQIIYKHWNDTDYNNVYTV